jgi:hypothetical protein
MLRRYVSKAGIRESLQRQTMWFDSLGVLEGVLEVEGEVGP